MQDRIAAGGCGIAADVIRGRMKLLSCWLLQVLLGAVGLLAAEPLVRLERCVAVPAPWADGDSFRVRSSEGREFTVRLYGADCVEWHVGDETDARRLREQRQYFGIAAQGGSVEMSVQLAKTFGRMAGERVGVLLSRPFTVHTAFTKALGDGRHERVYGFVTLEDGRDLAAVLVAEGLARAFGVHRRHRPGRVRTSTVRCCGIWNCRRRSWVGGCGSTRIGSGCRRSGGVSVRMTRSCRWRRVRRRARRRGPWIRTQRRGMS